MPARNLALLVLLVAPSMAWPQAIAPLPKEIKAEPSERLTQITYAVADLVVPIPGLDHSWPASKEEQNKTKEAWLIQKITASVAPGAWKGNGGSGTMQYVPTGMALAIKQTPPIQAQVAALLATMRSVQNVQVSVEMRVAGVSDEIFATLGRQYPDLKKSGQTILSDIQVLRMLEKAQGDERFDVLQASRLTVFPGQHCVVSVSDLLEAKVGAMVASNLRHVDLELKAEVAGLRFEKATRVVEGSTLVLSARKDRATQVLFMVTPRVIINLEETAVAPKPIPREALEPTPNTTVVQAHATVATPGPTSGNTTIQNLPKARTEIEPRQGKEKQLLFDMRLYEGDPLGSVDANTLTILSRPQCLTLENQSFLVNVGRSGFLLPDGTHPGPLGLIIQGTPGSVKDGKVSLDLTVSYSLPGVQTADLVQINTESTRTSMTVKLGTMVKLRLGKGTADKQRWVELMAQEFHETPENAGQGHY